jgi:hypothetical protein
MFFPERLWVHCQLTQTLRFQDPRLVRALGRKKLKNIFDSSPLTLTRKHGNIISYPTWIMCRKNSGTGEGFKKNVVNKGASSSAERYRLSKALPISNFYLLMFTKSGAMSKYPAYTEVRSILRHYI